MPTSYSMPTSFETCIQDALKSHNLALEDSKALAKSVLMLSDYFITQPEGATPWHESWAQIAYLVYFLPLNSTRLTRVIQEASTRGFFQGLNDVVDFGAGLATASLSLAETQNLNSYLVEKAIEPETLVKKYFPHFRAQEWHRTWGSHKIKNKDKTLAVFSYSLTELTDLPDWAYQCEALMLVEPSTQQDGRKLLQLRQRLIEKGFHVWAPCTHQLACPLLTQSKTDWCHDRIHFSAPTWFRKMEEYLPMKNRTLTLSYLLMRKTSPQKIEAARVVGDRLQEKGKDRQLICRGPEREFLAWLHKTGIHQEIPRGTLVKLSKDLTKVSNELRVLEEIFQFHPENF